MILIKLWRFFRIYGFRRTIFKAAGRSSRSLRLVIFGGRNRDVAIIGCGQFAFATISFFSSGYFLSRVKICFDIDLKKAEKLAFAQRCSIVNNVDDILRDPKVKYVYIASNHASHAEYAIQALKAGKICYVEKPLAVNWQQLKDLNELIQSKAYSDRLFVGYNRPFSKAIKLFKSLNVGKVQSLLSMGSFVSGHVIPESHWYRAPEEGTRICGNAGHWIDLFVHLLHHRGSLPEVLKIHYMAGNPSEPDDNFSLSICTDVGDVFNLILTARHEPFEGINETINLQQDNLICKIDDFRQATFWQDSKVLRIRCRPKDVGHKAAIHQPFSDTRRSWAELRYSAALTLVVTDMVNERVDNKTINMKALLDSF